nr:zinc finger, RanBP2-type [Tanacetum cinerariifolium]
AMMAASTAACYGHDASVVPGWKTGDWICNRYGCGTHNYASRMECYKCKSPRE